MNTPRLTTRAGLRSVVLASLLSSGPALAVSIDVTIDPAGPTAVGDTITVHLAISGWQAADGEVDSISFNVDFDTNYFEYVTGSGTTLDDGTEFLALPNQGAGYVLSNDSDDFFTGFGRYIFGVSDIGDFNTGSVGPAGNLGSFRLKAIAAGTSDIVPSSNNPNLIFFNPSCIGITPTGGVTMNGTSAPTTSPMTYPVWAAAIPFPAGEDDPEDDPDGDLVCNEMEYALDMNPLATDREKLPEIAIRNFGGKDFLAMSYDRPGGTIVRSDLTYRNRRSTDLENWSTAGVTIVSVSAPDPVTELETVVVRSSTPVGDGGLRTEFFDLLVSF